MLISEESPKRIREVIRNGNYRGDTANLAPGRVQANLVILKKDLALDFLSFCTVNPKPCPVIEVTTPGDPVPRISAPDADIRTDLGHYRVFKHGKLIEECSDIKSYWNDDMVAFLIGCSYSFEWILRSADIPLRHVQENCTVPVYKTNIQLNQVGVFKGTMAVSMRPLKPDYAIRAIQITSRYPLVHGAPVHMGFSEQIGIDINQPDFGNVVTIKDGELPLFWGCGVTPQIVAMESGVEFMITHSAGRMFITDLFVKDFGI